MLKIVEVHLSSTAQGEYVVLQNQGLVTVSLRGWALCTDSYLSGDTGAAAHDMHIFAEDEQIKPYTRVVLFTGQGPCGWCETNDGKHAYVAYWGRHDRVWMHADRINLLQLCSSRKIVQPMELAAAGRR